MLKLKRIGIRVTSIVTERTEAELNEILNQSNVQSTVNPQSITKIQC